MEPDNDMLAELLAEVGQRKDAFIANAERRDAEHAAATERAREESIRFNRSLIHAVK